MKKIILIAMIALVSCKKDSPTPITPVTEPPKTTTGSVMFYVPTYYMGEYGTGTKVWVNNVYLGKITTAYSSIPACNTYLGLIFSGDSATYSFHAELTDASKPSYNKIWDSTFVVIPSKCTPIKLTNQK